MGIAFQVCLSLSATFELLRFQAMCVVSSFFVVAKVCSNHYHYLMKCNAQRASHFKLRRNGYVGEHYFHQTLQSMYGKIENEHRENVIGENETLD